MMEKLEAFLRREINPLWVIAPFLSLAFFIMFLAWFFNGGGWTDEDTKYSIYTLAFLGGLGFVAYVLILYMTREKNEIRQHRVIMTGLRFSPYVILAIYLLLKYFGVVS